MILKRCSVCKKIKYIDRFHKYKAGKYGVKAICKECTKEYIKKYYKTHIKKYKQYSKQYRKDNIEKQKEQDKKYYVAHVKTYKKYNKQYYKTHIEQNNEYKDKENFGGNKRTVLERDRYICQKCNTDKNLIIHHIDGNGCGSVTKNHSVSNLITLCQSCHMKYHRKIKIINRLFAKIAGVLGHY